MKIQVGNMTGPMSKYGLFLAGVLVTGVSLYFFVSTSYYKTSFQEYQFRLTTNEVSESDLGDFTTTTLPPATPSTTPRAAEPDTTTFLKYMLNVPEWYRKGDWGLKKKESLETMAKPQNEYAGQDDEVAIAWNNFFYGTTNGVILELGAMDGQSFSVSKFFEAEAGWRTILIEGNPIQAALIPLNRPNALNFNAVICEKPSTVHFAQASGTGGIVEFMEKGFMQRFHINLLTNGILDTLKMDNAGNVIKVPCVPLIHLLYPLKFFHINYFMLDVEGGELNVLKAIDFEKIKFDVIAVETDRGTDSAEDTKIYVDAVIQFLTSKGYILWNRKIGRNSWFRHPDFIGYSKYNSIVKTDDLTTAIIPSLNKH